MLLPTLEWLVALLMLETLSEECCLRIRSSAGWAAPGPGDERRQCQNSLGNRMNGIHHPFLKEHFGKPALWQSLIPHGWIVDFKSLFLVMRLKSEMLQISGLLWSLGDSEGHISYDPEDWGLTGEPWSLCMQCKGVSHLCSWAQVCWWLHWWQPEQQHFVSSGVQLSSLTRSVPSPWIREKNIS